MTTKARFEYLEMLRPLRARIVNQRAELNRIQLYVDWFNKYVGLPSDFAFKVITAYPREFEQLCEMYRQKEASRAAGPRRSDLD